jgi:hypothetical protein
MVGHGFLLYSERIKSIEEAETLLRHFKKALVDIHTVARERENLGKPAPSMDEHVIVGKIKELEQLIETHEKNLPPLYIYRALKGSRTLVEAVTFDENGKNLPQDIVVGKWEFTGHVDKDKKKPEWFWSKNGSKHRTILAEHGYCHIDMAFMVEEEDTKRWDRSKDDKQSYESSEASASGASA